MDVVVNFMQADPSFAGVGAYYSQSPAKTFMGAEPCIPLAVVAEALDQMQKGGASPKHVSASKHALKADHTSCAALCTMSSQTQCANAAQKAMAAGPANQHAMTALKQCMETANAHCVSLCDTGAHGHHHQGHHHHHK